MESAIQQDRSWSLVLVVVIKLALGGIDSDLLVVLLQRRQVLTRLRELALLHALAHIPVHERALRVHQVELVVQSAQIFFLLY
jgi:hypothetical protein